MLLLGSDWLIEETSSSVSSLSEVRAKLSERSHKLDRSAIGQIGSNALNVRCKAETGGQIPSTGVKSGEDLSLGAYRCVPPPNQLR
jgi:hypothetical protein